MAAETKRLVMNDVNLVVVDVLNFVSADAFVCEFVSHYPYEQKKVLARAVARKIESLRASIERDVELETSLDSADEESKRSSV